MYAFKEELKDAYGEIDRLRAALEDVVASGLLHGPTTLSDKVLGIVHAALETPKPRSTEGAIDPEATW